MVDQKVPKIAIITRTGDRNLFLKRAIESVENQTYPDYIHVIFNNGGDKKSLETLVNKYKNKRRIIIHHPERVGHPRALNLAIKPVNSEYITILDDDDTWPPERLEKTVGYLDQTGEAAVIVKMDVIIEEIHGQEIRKISQHLHPESGEGEVSLFKQCQKNYLSNGIITYRREIYDELKGYDETLPTADDWDFGIRLLLKHDVAFLRKEKPLLFYHQRPSEKGINGNSVHARVEQQEKAINMIRNRYLRDDLNRGRLGVGFIMNSLEADKEIAIRLEGHVNYTAENINQQIDRTADRVIQTINSSMLANKVIRKIRRQ